jgi:hypothetical protein
MIRRITAFRSDESTPASDLARDSGHARHRGGHCGNAQPGFRGDRWCVDREFNYVDDPRNVVIDMSDSHIWDASTVAARDP